MPLLSLSAVAKSVPGGRLLFEGLDLQIHAGQFVAVMGESGVGKSTLLNVVAGLDRPDAGSVAVKGRPLEPMSDDERTLIRRDRIGFVFQAFHILPHLTLAQNVALPLVLQHVAAADAADRAAAMLGAVGIAGRGGDYPRQLSGGELQRVAIARALVHRPALILADEPTGNLDQETAQRVMDLLVGQIRDLGAAALLVTHSEMAAAAADRILQLTATGLIDRRG